MRAANESYALKMNIIVILNCHDGGQLINDMRSGAKFFYCINALKHLKLTTRYEGKKTFKLQNPLETVLMSKYSKTKV